MAEKEKLVGVLINMPIYLKDNFKKALEHNGSNMNAVVRILIAEYVVKMQHLECAISRKALKKTRRCKNEKNTQTQNSEE